MLARPGRAQIPTLADLHLNRPDRSSSLFAGWGVNINGNRLS